MDTNGKQGYSMKSLQEYVKNFSDRELAEGVKVPKIIRWQAGNRFIPILADTVGDVAHMSDCFIRKLPTDESFTVCYKDSNSSCLRKRRGAYLLGYTYGFRIHIESLKSLYFIPTNITQKKKIIGKFKISVR